MQLKLKRVQLWLHHHYQEVRHWILIILGVTLLVFSLISVAKQNRLISQVNILAIQNKTLSEQNKSLNQQTKNLGEENQVIAKQNRSYTKCIATVFALYTHDFTPVDITNLDTCTVENQERAANEAQSNTTTTTVPTKSNSSTTQTQTSVPAVNTTITPTTTNTDTPNIDSNNDGPIPGLNCKIDLLGLHIGC